MEIKNAAEHANIGVAQEGCIVFPKLGLKVLLVKNVHASTRIIALMPTVVSIKNGHS